MCVCVQLNRLPSLVCHTHVYERDCKALNVSAVVHGKRMTSRMPLSVLLCAENAGAILRESQTSL